MEEILSFIIQSCLRVFEDVDGMVCSVGEADIHFLDLTQINDSINDKIYPGLSLPISDHTPGTLLGYDAHTVSNMVALLALWASGAVEL